MLHTLESADPVETLEARPATPTAPVIAVGVDGSDDSAPALLFAATEAVVRGGSLRIICAYELPRLTYAAGIEMPIEVVRMMSAAAKQEAAGAVAVARSVAGAADLEISGVAVPGRASRVLIDHSSDAAMLVVGTRRLGGAGRLFLGSVSTELIHHSPIPVVVVPGNRPDEDHA